jgi:hypothetical protein
MDVETLEALKGSIAKWEAIVDGTGYDAGAINCPLCKVFRRVTADGAKCGACPVKARSGFHGCKGTPYEDVERAREPMDEAAAALAELNFLKSLLPES